jgi:hypothetical protein
MAAIKSKGTTPERVVRRVVSGLGFRYRLHGKKLPGTPDLVFAKLKKAIEVRGVFLAHARVRAVQDPGDAAGILGGEAEPQPAAGSAERGGVEEIGVATAGGVGVSGAGGGEARAAGGAVPENDGLMRAPSRRRRRGFRPIWPPS